MSTNPDNFCRVCGYDFGAPLHEPTITFLICPCCIAEAGVDDDTLEDVRAYRQQWLDEGGKWRRPPYAQPPEVREPPNWNREEQMKNIPPEWL